MALYAGDPDNYPASADLPEGGTQRNAGSVRVGDEAALDRTAYLNDGRARTYIVTIDATSETDPSDLATSGSLGATNPIDVPGLTITIPDAVEGAVVIIQAQLAWQTNGANVEGRALLSVTEDVGGANDNFILEGSKVWIVEDAISRTVPLLGRWEITQDGDFKIAINVLGTGGNGGGGAFDTSSDRIRILKGCTIVATYYKKPEPV